MKHLPSNPTPLISGELMKITKKLIIFTASQVLFCAIAPLVFIFIEYGDESDGLKLKLPLGILLVAFVILIIAKNTFLKPRMQKLSVQIAQQEADLAIESNADKIKNIVSELKRKRVIECVLNAFAPVLLFGVLLLACRAMESAILRLSGAIGFTLVSYIVGTVFGIFAAREVHGKHEG